MKTHEWSFRARAAFWFAIAFIISALLQFPASIHESAMKKRIREIEAATKAQLGPEPSMADVGRVLGQQGFRVWSSTTRKESVVIAQRGLASGTIFWRPASVDVRVFFNAEGQHAEWMLWPFASQGYTSSSFDEIARYGGFLWLVALAAIYVAYSRRCRRIRRGLCPACAYPVGDSTVCTECGKPSIKQKAEMT